MKLKIDPNLLCTTLQCQRVRVVAVFADRIGRITLDAIERLANGVFVQSFEIGDAAELQRFLGSTNTDSLESSLTARQLAVGAYQRARVRPDAGQHTHEIGLAVSRLSQSGGHVVIHNQWATHQCTFQLPSKRAQFPGNASASALVEHLRNVILNGFARVIGQTDLGSGTADEHPSVTWFHASAKPTWRELIEGERPVSGHYPERPVLFPGSFHPIHQGHRQMLAVASSQLDQPVHLEISVTNADKPSLDYLTIAQRVRQAESIAPVVLTRAPRFVDKARLFPGATFLVGADTAIRLDDLRFYDGCANQRDRAIQAITDQGCRFLVFGRLVQQKFHDAAKLSLTHGLRELCDFVPTTEFRIDISSRELRRQVEDRPT